MKSIFFYKFPKKGVIMTQDELDIIFMKKALKEAQKAKRFNEIPIGAVLVKNGVIYHRSSNKTRTLNNPLAHAEKLVIDQALKSGEKFLTDYTLYVTIEPCIMCAGMIVWSRIGRVVFGAYDSKVGAVGSIYNILQDKNINHNPLVKGGIMKTETAQIIIDFFKEKREKIKQESA